jgi:hypothetical protein
VLSDRRAAAFVLRKKLGYGSKVHGWSELGRPRDRAWILLEELGAPCKVRLRIGLVPRQELIVV